MHTHTHTQSPPQLARFYNNIHNATFACHSQQQQRKATASATAGSKDTQAVIRVAYFSGHGH